VTINSSDSFNLVTSGHCENGQIIEEKIKQERIKSFSLLIQIKNEPKFTFV